MTSTKAKAGTRASRIVGGVISATIIVALFFWAAGRFDWLRGWAFIGLLALGRSAHALYLRRASPDLPRRRRGVEEGTRPWDILVLKCFGLAYVATAIVAALDERLGGPAMGLGWWGAGAGLYVLSLIFISWAMTVNTHFENTARIQTDRGHRVIDTGPYRIVRHPGYCGTILGFVCPVPLLLGSWWAFIPTVLTAAILILRTYLEDRMLRAELTGYEAYAQRVRYRLLPGVW